MFNALMHRPRNIRERNKDERTSKLTAGLRMAFRHEIRFDDYLMRVWVTALIVGCSMSIIGTLRNGQIDFSLLLPFNGWHARNNDGVLYVELWANILGNSLQAGFALWGSVLLFLGSYRAFTAHKFVFGCFSLSIAFIGFAMAVPSWLQQLLILIVDKCPYLIQ